MEKTFADNLKVFLGTNSKKYVLSDFEERKIIKFVVVFFKFGTNCFVRNANLPACFFHYSKSKNIIWHPIFSSEKVLMLGSSWEGYRLLQCSVKFFTCVVTRTTFFLPINEQNQFWTKKTYFFCQKMFFWHILKYSVYHCNNLWFL